MLIGFFFGQVNLASLWLRLVEAALHSWPFFYLFIFMSLPIYFDAISSFLVYVGRKRKAQVWESWCTQLWQVDSFGLHIRYSKWVGISIPNQPAKRDTKQSTLRNMHFTSSGLDSNSSSKNVVNDPVRVHITRAHAPWQAPYPEKTWLWQCSWLWPLDDSDSGIIVTYQ